MYKLPAAIKYLKKYLNMLRQTNGCVIHTVQINVMDKVQLQTNSLPAGWLVGGRSGVHSC